jgi:DNA-binding beta-propeller fold protein YncE
MSRAPWMVVLSLPVWAGLAACGAANSERSSPAASADAGARPSTPCHGANECGPGEECNEFGYCQTIHSTADGGVGEGLLPPEVESKTEPPVGGKRFVYVAVPEQDMVAKIDSESLAVRAVTVGKDPGALRTIAGEDVAVLLNRGSATASILRSTPDGGDAILTLKTSSGLNQLAVSPDGKHAVAYFDVILARGAIPPKQSLQEVTLIHLEAGQEQSVVLPVGFRPSDVQFSAAGDKAFVLTEQGFSVIEFAKVTQPTLVPTIPLVRDALKETKPSEVLVTPDGKLALLRQDGTKGIRAVSLETKEMTDVVLPGEPTDLDLTVDGALAVAVLRDASQVALLDIPGDLHDPTQIEMLLTTGYTVGQVAVTQDNKTAFLFSNATEQKVLLVADLKARTLAASPLKKGVRSVQSTPDGRIAVVLHNKVPGTPTPEEGLDALLDKSWGYSLYSLDSGFIKLQLTDADPGPLAFSPDSLTGYLLLNDPSRSVRSVEALDLKSFLVSSIGLGSPPVSVGVMAATRKVYVTQSHPLGRVTFVDMGSLKTKTVTGFELNSHIVE